MNEKDNPINGLEPFVDTPIATSHGIAAIALNMAMKYHDFSTVKDGALYQQYKLEGKNMREIHIDMVFETAILIEIHLLGSSQRIAKLVVDAIASEDEEIEQTPGHPEQFDEPGLPDKETKLCSTKLSKTNLPNSSWRMATASASSWSFGTSK